jgi:hypothetical protein
MAGMTTIDDQTAPTSSSVRRRGKGKRRRPATAASVRTRRYRQRRQKGIAMVLVEVDAGVLDFMIMTRWLCESEADKPHAIGPAISALLRDAAKSHQ